MGFTSLIYDKGRMMAQETTSITQKRLPPLSGRADVVSLEPFELKVKMKSSLTPPILTRNGETKSGDCAQLQQATMADVRSLLRAERAARAPPKIRKQLEVPAPPSPPRPNKKRKADDSEIATTETRKRTKVKVSTSLPSGFFDGAEEEDEDEDETGDEEVIKESREYPRKASIAATEGPPTLPRSSIPAAIPDGSTKNLDDEWAAFQQDIASIPDPSKTALNALSANAVLQAAPVSATDVSSQPLTDPSNVQKRRDEEIEEEKEDASRALEEEFEEMEVLQERLRKLKEKRERLKLSKAEVIETAADKAEPVTREGSDDDNDDDDNEDGDEWDGWRFGTS
ncbi:hypothetical protein FKW77_005887 [Venturia effusa]|uniref:Uncharacterized protein n=1 Tax=Venturia effusa TaxID=50376 RepID=A0A517L9E5_9PEZI|nr:hypothetical protein FKW77_005887 [Venturia effusa]